MSITVKELKEFLNTVPDDTEIKILQTTNVGYGIEISYNKLNSIEEIEYYPATEKYPVGLICFGEMC